ncbi:MAG: hypothetical protein LUE29_03600 [Lachnospiraceae bacterium]|nr:hypothetical protein [Lachnospiraceae bacterium]
MSQNKSDPDKKQDVEETKRKIIRTGLCAGAIVLVLLLIILVVAVVKMNGAE